VVSVDNYGAFDRREYDNALSLAGAKPIALGEVGTAPSAAVLREQPRWTWFMIWSEFVEFSNPLDALRALLAAPNVAGRDDARLAKAMTAIRSASAAPVAEPVTPAATAEAKALLARLYAASGRQTLAGQDEDPLAPGAAGRRVVEATGRQPALCGGELAVPSKPGVEPAAARRALLEDAESQSRAGCLVSLSWRPARPTDDEQGLADDALRGGLTDYEWNELLSAGSRLEARWRNQTDVLADALRRLQEKNVAVLLRPYPRPNAKEACGRGARACAVRRRSTGDCSSGWWTITACTTWCGSGARRLRDSDRTGPVPITTTSRD